jgi:serine/threonine protein phosphatase PrpC
MYPGTAFTRSIGDMAAERIGVVADPEVSIKNLEHNVEFLVLASDGVFEFMSSQTVVNMVRPQLTPLSPLFSSICHFTL